MITKVEDKETKKKICLQILDDLPEWFGILESKLEYANGCREVPFWIDIEEDTIRGFIAVKETSKYTAEIYVMGVKRKYHRLGIGRKLFEVLYLYAKEKGYKFIQVKTVKQGLYAEYDITNVFYQKLGFKEFECMTELWDKANPCQIYVMAVADK